MNLLFIIVLIASAIGTASYVAIMIMNTETPEQYRTLKRFASVMAIILAVLFSLLVLFHALNSTTT